jgi:hypothetical protein
LSIEDGELGSSNEDVRLSIAVEVACADIDRTILCEGDGKWVGG